MNSLFTFLLFIATAYTAIAQGIVGDWQGVLKVQGTSLTLVFHIDEAEGGYKGSMDSPDQGALDIPVPFVSLEQNKLVMKIPTALIQYDGVMSGTGLIEGTFTQSGQSFPLNLSKKIILKEGKKYQEPGLPLGYTEEEVLFQNLEADINLSGTLTLPMGEDKYPAAILITGSGPQNRNEEIAGHKPFLVLADHLAKNGIAVLRFDDRGVGKSEGDFQGASTLDFATDVEAALSFMRTRHEINQNKIGLIGHSEGGVIAPMVASEDTDVRFIVLLAGTGISGKEVLLSQSKKAGELSELSDEERIIMNNLYAEVYNLIAASERVEPLKKMLIDYFERKWPDIPTTMRSGMEKANYVRWQVDQLATPWMHFFITYAPATALQKVSCPVLALNGEMDWQVPHEVNLKAIEKALHKGGNQQATIKSLPGLNHLFQESKTGSPLEYAQLEQTFSPIALQAVSSWLKELLAD